MASSDRQHVSRLVPRSSSTLTVLLIVVAVVNSATLGFDSSMMNGLNILPQYKDYFHLNASTRGLLTAGSWLGGVIATFFMQWVPDRFGRKPTILIAACIGVVAAIIQGAAQNTGMFVIGRILSGIAGQLSGGAAPTLIGETIKPRYRGTILGIFFSCYYVGSLIASAVNYRTVDIATTWAWRIPSILQCVPSLLSLACLPFVPESPRWLVANGKPEHAREVLAIVYENNVSETTEVLEEIKTTLKYEEEQYPANPWKELITGTPNLRRLVIIVSFGLLIETLGNFVISFYLGTMLTQAGITNPTTQLQINVILNCWCFVVAVVGSFLLDVVGRRKQTLWCMVGMIATFYIAGGLTKSFGESTNTSGIYATIAFIFLFQGFYSASITPMTTAYPPEIMPYHTRNAGIAVFRFLDCSTGMMYSFLMSYAMDNLGWKFFMVNASYDIIFLVVMYYFWIETKGIPLEEIAVKFGSETMSDGGDGNATFVDKGGVDIGVKQA
ncbi:hexose transporter [Lophium mytilinum]|uniref:Hexose transporter n=1 Tax=Lophium mytilinum TaxID=390894 RepID=A0A6A6QCB2_9PEZI|nr:hexose transporter [Lophium mytilinum]